MRHRDVRTLAVLGLALGLVLFALPAVQAESTCSSNHPAPMTSADAAPAVPDCDCCDGASGPTSDVTMPCSACVAMAAPPFVDLPHLVAIRHADTPVALHSLTSSTQLDRPPMR